MPSRHEPKVRTVEFPARMVIVRRPAAPPKPTPPPPPPRVTYHLPPDLLYPTRPVRVPSSPPTPASPVQRPAPAPLPPYLPPRVPMPAPPALPRNPVQPVFPAPRRDTASSSSQPLETMTVGEWEHLSARDKGRVLEQLNLPVPPQYRREVLDANDTIGAYWTLLGAFVSILSGLPFFRGSPVPRRLPVPVAKTVVKPRPIPPAPKSIPEIHWGQQGKHLRGKHNFDPNRGEITVDPRELFKRAGTGQSANGIPIGQAGSNERVDFQYVIGFYVSNDPKRLVPPPGIPTTVGMIHYGKKGAHVRPAAPKGFVAPKIN